jgi:hypothetical protein
MGIILAWENLKSTGPLESRQEFQIQKNGQMRLAPAPFGFGTVEFGIAGIPNQAAAEFLRKPCK